MEISNKDPYIQTWSGQKFFFGTPDNYNYSIEEIGYVLNNNCRYTGHSEPFYSVLDHSILVSDLIMEYTGDPELSLAGLLHDAHEAYIGDISTPLSNFLCSDKIERLKINIQFALEKQLLNRVINNGDNKKIIHQYDAMAFDIEFKQFLLKEKNVIRRIRLEDLDNSIPKFINMYKDLKYKIAQGEYLWT